jgi:hypothetical protein
MAGYDFTNKKFGNLIAKKIVKRDSSGHNYWQCICDCGKIVIVRSTELMNGKTTMCNDCKKSKMSHLRTDHSIKNITNNHDSSNWLDDNNIQPKNIDDYMNVLDLRKIDKNVDILSAPIIYKIVHAINADLTYSNTAYLGNGCMGESLAKQIDDFFHIRTQLDELKLLNWEVGEVIYTAPVYHLLTKKDRNDDISYDNVFSCLSELENKARIEGNYYLAFPRICCGKDKLDWNIIEQMILYLFGEDFNILLF